VSEWHLNKSVTYGHLVTTATAVLGVVWWAASVEKQVEVNAAEVGHVREIVQLQNAYTNDKIDEIKKSIEAMDKKLDRLIERNK
jgi:hypothetical protein